MKNSLKRAQRHLTAGMIIFLAMILLSCSSKNAIKNYSGDGEIRARPGGVLAGGGGCILKFKPIKLNQPSKFDYRFKGLPDWRFTVFFAIDDKQNWPDKKQSLSGTLEMKIKDTSGTVVLQFHRKLSDLVWSRAGLGPWELYDLDHVEFRPKSDMEYVLEVSIDPDSLLKDDEGYVLLRGGGHEGLSIGF